MKLRYQICDTERCTDRNLKSLYDEEDNRYLCREGDSVFVSPLSWDRGIGPYFDDVARKTAVPFDDLDECWLIDLELD